MPWFAGASAAVPPGQVAGVAHRAGRARCIARAQTSAESGAPATVTGLAHTGIRAEAQDAARRIGGHRQRVATGRCTGIEQELVEPLCAGRDRRACPDQVKQRIEPWPTWIRYHCTSHRQPGQCVIAITPAGSSGRLCCTVVTPATSVRPLSVPSELLAPAWLTERTLLEFVVPSVTPISRRYGAVSLGHRTPEHAPPLWFAKFPHGFKPGAEPEKGSRYLRQSVAVVGHQLAAVVDLDRPQPATGAAGVTDTVVVVIAPDRTTDSNT